MKINLCQLGVLVITSILLSACKTNLVRLNKIDVLESTTESFKYDLKTRMDLAMQQEVEKTKDPELGYVPRERLNEAIEYTKQLQAGKEKLHKAAISGITWQEMGPSNVGGRTRALMFDPNDPNYKRVFAAGVAGGLWVTDNIYASEPNWTPINEFFGNMAITCLAHDPLRPDTMYFGTGEGYFNADAVRGDGIYKSVDGGATWSQVTTAGLSTFNYIQKIVVASNGDVLASTRDGGVQKSTNSGATWTKVLGSGVTASTNRANDLDIDASGNIYATMGIFDQDGVYKSSNNGTSWTKVSSGTGFPGSGFYRIEVACAPSDTNIVYAILHNSSNNQCLGIYRSFDAGSTWSVGTMPRSAVDSGNVASSQAWYDLTIVVDPKNAATLIVGGLDLYKSTNYGSGWTQLSHWSGGASLPEVHADQQVNVYRPNSSDTVLFGNDGGVYLATGMSGTPTFYEKESNYNTTQFYACALHPAKGKNYALAGSQDNGSHKFTNGGINETTEVTGGDGAYVHIDQNDPKYQFTSYVYNQYRRSSDSGATFTSYNFDASSTNGKFINPTDYDNSTGNLYCAWSSGNYAIWLNAKTTSSFTTVSASFTGQVSAVTVDENTANRVWFGTDDRRVYYVDNAASSPSVTNTTSSFPSGWPGANNVVSCISIERGNPSHVLVTFSNYGVTSVWESTNTGASWTSVEGNLPDMPIRWGMFSPLGGDSALLATELGVWSTTNLNGGSTNWQPSNTGLANVRTDMLQFRSSDSTVIAATHGRGLYATKFFSKIVAPRFAISDSIVHVGEYVHFYDDSYGATSYAWDMDNDGITDTTGAHVAWAFASGGYKTVRLTINGSLYTTQIIHVLPRLGTPYTTSDGGNFESNFWHFGGRAISGGVNLWEHGVPTNALTTLNSATRAWKTDLDADIIDGEYECALYSPSFNMTSSGSYTLSFRRSMEVTYCNAPFAVQAQYSIDGGNNWVRLGSETSGGTNWYNRGASTCGICCIESTIFSDRTGWTVTSNNISASHSISSLAGNADVRFRIVFSVSTGYSAVGYQNDGFMVDDFTISGPTNTVAQIPVETALCSRTLPLPANDSAFFYSPNGKIMGVVRNLSAHDFGNTTMTIDQAGTTPVDFDTVTAVERRRLAKTVKITPTTNNTGAKVEIQMFYDKTTEIDAWKTVTSNSAKNIQLFKSPNGINSATIANSIYGDSTVIDSVYGASGVRIVARFNNGFSGVGSGGGGGGTPGPLPVTWVSINGKRLTDKVELTFQTGSEINNSHFDIERRGFNSSDEFIAVGNVKGKGNYNGLSTYLFEDKDPKALENTPLFYRVKQVDFDGKYDYSEVVFIAPTNLSNKNIKVYPLPVVETLNIDVNLDHVGLVANIYDMQGRLIIAHQLNNKSTKISTTELISGQYLMIVTDGRQVFYNDKIVKN